MIENNWKPIIDAEINKSYFKELSAFVHEEYRTKVIYPSAKNIFRCFELTDYQNVKVVILGQDPYMRPNQAHGLCFSVQNGVDIPPSLKNIYKEIQDDLGIIPPNSGFLEKWATQGVLLLNTILSVEEGKPLSHKGNGWEVFTDHIIEILNYDNTPKVFMLWGNESKQKALMITNKNHLVLTASHPSPLGAYKGFFGCHHFSKANAFLIQNGRTPINWDLK